MTTLNRYGSLAAEVYDIDKPFFARPDTALHLERFDGFSGPILEPACGSGRTLVPFLQAGLDVTGFDPSLEMLDRCRARCEEAGVPADLSQQRFEDFSYERTFAAILVPVGSFTLIDDFATAIAVLRRFRDHLEPGGLLVLDIPALSSLAPQSDDRRRWTADNGDLLTMEGVTSSPDWLRQRVEKTCRYDRWREGRLVESEIDIYALRSWGLEELRLALEATGFAQVKVFANYRRDRAPRPHDHTWTFEAVRA